MAAADSQVIKIKKIIKKPERRLGLANGGKRRCLAEPRGGAGEKRGWRARAGRKAPAPARPGPRVTVLMAVLVLEEERAGEGWRRRQAEGAADFRAAAAVLAGVVVVVAALEGFRRNPVWR